MNINYNQIRHWRPGNNSYFHIKNMTTHDGTLSIAKSVTDAPSVTVQYSFNGTNWTTLGTTTTTPLELNVPKHTKVYLRATANAWANADGYNSITMDVEHRISGNIMSLLAGSSFDGTETVISTARAFQKLFYNDTMLVDASMLKMPATTISQYCYANTFYMCSNMVGAPAILPATTLQPYCYSGMFVGCSSLVSAPELPATTLKQFCYAGMFSACTSLGKIVANFESWPSNSALTDTDYHATYNWTQYAKADGLFKINNAVLPETKNASGNQTDAHYIPYDWTVDKLNYRYIPFYIEDVSGTASTLTVETEGTDATDVEYSLDGTTWTSSKPQIPANGKVYIRAHAYQWHQDGSDFAHIYSNNDFNVAGNVMSLFYGSNFTGNETTFPNDSEHSMRLLYMFLNCTGLVDAGNLILPALSLRTHDYFYTFSGCTNLIAAPAVPDAAVNGEEVLRGMYKGCSSLALAPEILISTTTGYNGFLEMFQGTAIESITFHVQNIRDYGLNWMWQGNHAISEITFANPNFEWDEDNAGGWMYDAGAQTGVIYKPAGVSITPTDSENGLPVGWTQQDIA